MTFARRMTISELNLRGPNLWELMLLRMNGADDRGRHRDQRMGWSDARGGRRGVNQKTKRLARLAQAREWVEARRCE